jgi:hypothetical protein
MRLTPFSAFATTRDIAPGTETVSDGTVRIRERLFTDVVESDSPRIAGINEPLLDLDVDAQAGTGTVQGPFVLKPTDGAGTWEGRLTGKLVNGMVTAWGLARGTGAFEGSVLRVDFQQVAAHPSSPPVAEAKAFFEMSGHILDPG